ncbi:MAG: low molecular weight protein-tyrosine-phosphatase [Acutalibacteraceae bacterium]
MVKINFICHGNICRSPMAEFVMKDLVKKQGLKDKFIISSSATSREEIGNPVHTGTKRKLYEQSIAVSNDKRAVQFEKSDYDKYDFLVVMDGNNERNLFRIIKSDPKNKVFRLLDFTERKGDIADPWYTGNFDKTFEDIFEGCNGLLTYINKNRIL